VEDAAAVGVSHGLGQGRQERARLLRREGALVLEALLEVSALDELQDQVGLVALPGRAVDAYDRGVVEAG